MPFAKIKSVKAQTSIEYLGTYAWALLALVSTIGALSYFGVLNPGAYSSERCDSGSQIECLDATVDDLGRVYFQFRNNYDKEVTLVSVGISDVLGNSGIDVLPGRSGTIFVDTPRSFSGKEDIEFNLTYRRTAGTTEHTILGTGVVQVQSRTGLEAIGFCGDTLIGSDEACDYSSVGYQCFGYECLSDCSCKNIEYDLCGNGRIDAKDGGVLEECDPNDPITTSSCFSGVCDPDSCECV